MQMHVCICAHIEACTHKKHERRKARKHTRTPAHPEAHRHSHAYVRCAISCMRPTHELSTQRGQLGHSRSDDIQRTHALPHAHGSARTRGLFRAVCRVCAAGDGPDATRRRQGMLRRVCADGGSIPAGTASELDACGVKEIYSTNYAFAAVCANGRVRAWGDSTCTQPHVLCGPSSRAAQDMNTRSQPRKHARTHKSMQWHACIH